MVVWHREITERSFLSKKDTTRERETKTPRSIHRQFQRFNHRRAFLRRLLTFFCSSDYTMNGGPSGFSTIPPITFSEYLFVLFFCDWWWSKVSNFADNAPVTRAFVITSALFTVFFGIRGGGGGGSSKLGLSYQVDYLSPSKALLFTLISMLGFQLFSFKGSCFIEGGSS